MFSQTQLEEIRTAAREQATCNAIEEVPRENVAQFGTVTDPPERIIEQQQQQRHNISTYSPDESGSSSPSSSSSSNSSFSSPSAVPSPPRQRRPPLRRESFEIAQQDGSQSRRRLSAASTTTASLSKPGLTSSSSSSISTSQIVGSLNNNKRGTVDGDNNEKFAEMKLNELMFAASNDDDESDSTDTSLSILKRNYDILRQKSAAGVDGSQPSLLQPNESSSLNNSLLENNEEISLRGELENVNRNNRLVGLIVVKYCGCLKNYYVNSFLLFIDEHRQLMESNQRRAKRRQMYRLCRRVQ